MSLTNPTRVLAIRHGETAWNVDTRLQGQLDIGLNERGHWQARRLADALAHESVTAIYSSDLSRAMDTARPLAQTLGLDVRPDTGLRERHFGAFQGATVEEVMARWPDDSARWRRRDPEFCPPDGESLSGFYARCVPAAERLAAQHPGETIVLVAHGGVLDCWYRAATRIDLQSARTWSLGNASINRLLYTGDGFTLVGWSDTQHLDESAEDPRDEISEAHAPLPRRDSAA